MVTASTLRGIDLAGHDGRAGLVFGKDEFAETATGAGGEPANVVGNFHERCGESFQGTAGEDDFVVSGEACEFIRVRAEGQAGEFGDFLGGALGEFRVSIQAGADSGATNGEIEEAVESNSDARAIAIEKADPAGKFLTDGERRRVLKVGATDFDDADEFLGFGVESIAQFLERGKKAAGSFRGRGNVHGGGEGVVGGL